MLWLCIHRPDLPLEALSPPPDTLVAVVETRASRRILIRVSTLAQSRGAQPGMPASSALTLVPELQLLERKPDLEQQALEALACFAYRFGAPVCCATDHNCVWVEVRRSLSMFGGWRAFRVELAREAQALGYALQFGVAPTQAAAAVLAHADIGLQRPIARPGDIALALRDKPLHLLPLSEKTLDVLHGSGLRTIGQVTALPRDALSRRFGTTVAAYLDRLLGIAPEVWDAYEPPVQYRRRVEFAGIVQTTEALLFPLRAMIGEFCQYLRARDVAVQAFRLSLIDGFRKCSHLEIGLLAPTRDPTRLLLVLREKLDKLTIDNGVQELRLDADRFEAAAVVQEDLFQRGPNTEDVATLHERLQARLGPEALHRLSVTPDHRPEKAWSEHRVDAEGGHPPRPLWLLPQPHVIAAPRLLGPAERIESGWWDGGAAVRDYFVAEDETGRRVWVYREPEGEQWWLHGLWQ